jgi:stearoyl-CoA desaturase (delta-9 desaturase)
MTTKQKIIFLMKTLVFVSIFITLWIIVPLYGKVFMVIWYGGLLFQSGFLHRYAAHQQYKMSKSMEKTFYICTWFLQGSSYLSPVAYGIMHRLHHTYTDTEKDPHSPSHQSSFVRMMWRTRNIYNEIFYQKTILGKKIEDKYFKNLPIWNWFDKFASSIFSRLLWIIIYSIIYYYIGIYTNIVGWEWIIVAILSLLSIIMAPIHGAIINWWGHIYGYHNHDVENTSTNISIGKTSKVQWYQIPFVMMMNFLMMGENSHNNHHAKQYSANFAEKWWEYDIIYFILLIANKVNIIKKLKH